MSITLHHHRASHALRLPGGREGRGTCAAGMPSQPWTRFEMRANNAGFTGVVVVVDPADLKPVTPPGGA